VRSDKATLRDVIFCIMVVWVILGFGVMGWALGHAFDG